MKKLITLLLALTLCLSLCAPALAKYPETWDEAKDKFELTSNIFEYDNYVKYEQEVPCYDWDLVYDSDYGDYVDILIEAGSFKGYNIIGNDDTITFTNTGKGDDYVVAVFCKTYDWDELESGWVLNLLLDGYYGASLRQGGFFETTEADANWERDSHNTLPETSWGVMLEANESITIPASALAGYSRTTDPSKLYQVTMEQYYPKEDRYWYVTYNFMVDDTKAAAVKAAGKTPAEEGNPFTDVPKDAYYHDAVLWAVENGVTKGMTETTFEPKGTCTRGQVVTFLWRAMGCPEPTTTENPFTDVKEADYFYKAVLWAVENGITQGMTATTFGPNDTCTSGHVVTFLWRASGKPAAENDGASWYSEAVAWAQGQKLLEGTDTAFAPENLSPRGDIVTYLYRVLKK